MSSNSNAKPEQVKSQISKQIKASSFNKIYLRQVSTFLTFLWNVSSFLSKSEDDSDIFVSITYKIGVIAKMGGKSVTYFSNVVLDQDFATTSQSETSVSYGEDYQFQESRKDMLMVNEPEYHKVKVQIFLNHNLKNTVDT